MYQPIRGQGGHLVFLIGPKTTNLVEDIEFLNHQILFSGVRDEVENVSANGRPRRLVFVFLSAPKNNLVKLLKYSRENEVKTVFNCSTSTFRPQAFFKKTKLKLLSHCCHCLFNFPQMFLILFYDAHIVHFWRVPVHLSSTASLYAVVTSRCERLARHYARLCNPAKGSL